MPSHPPEQSTAPLEDAGFGREDLGPIEPRPLESLRPYHTEWLPPFRMAAWYREELMREIQAAGMRTPLVVLTDGRVIDGLVRLEIARALGLPSVPTQALRVRLPLDPVMQYRIERFRLDLAVQRRQLSEREIDCLLVELEVARADPEVLAGQATRAAGEPPPPLPSGPTAQQWARALGRSPEHIQRLLTLARAQGQSDDSEFSQRLRAGQVVSVRDEYEQLKARRRAWEDTVAELIQAWRTVSELVVHTVGESHAWPTDEREQLLDLFRKSEAALIECADSLSA